MPPPGPQPDDAGGPGDPEAPGDIGGGGDGVEALEGAIEGLPEEVRRCFILCYHRGFTHDEIAELMRLPQAAVAAHLEEARRRLDPWLEADE